MKAFSMLAWNFMHFYCIIPLKKRDNSIHKFYDLVHFFEKMLVLFERFAGIARILALFASYSVIIFNGLAVLTIIEPHRIHTLN